MAVDNPISSLPSYKNPPVIEVVAGVTFNKLEDLLVPHFGIFWQKLRETYPSCQHAPSLDFRPDRFEVSAGFSTEPFPLPLPRIWLLNKKQNELIQLQNNRFLFNWRKMDETELYPRYEHVIQVYKENFTIFEQFLEEEDLGKLNYSNCELTYINHIFKGEGWGSVTDIQKVLPDLTWRSAENRFLPEPLHLGWQALFSLPDDNGQLQVKLEQGFRKSDHREVLVLELTASRSIKDNSLAEIWNWFELAHEWIVRGFTDLTEKNVQVSVWGREDE
jgi:uncharacterized protein (TIGR04255 family)